MARPSNIDKLPEDIRAELHSKLLRTNFTGYEWLSLWLADKGFSASKSAIQRYAVMRKDEILGLHQESKFHQAQLILNALSVATMLSPGKDLGSLKDDADALLKWALFGY
ncbi:phage protein Gp27 family protein [Candidatus Symbiopectobacterium sp. PLON1]|uniref:phage protein Gp27 family protein n=1 Tax=Candidatus Symbiopectobacterium sp. PLON1 TaxID=2794575 RepID=UPI001A272DEA|nr:phage protein Gp27 family protein [Candidatus Symbiopectobacterium sp. PLON1]MBG6248235.1 DUF3486 family protein [Candidatus Symbiopectobacterium sp. PLON1]